MQILERREFLKYLGSVAAAALVIGCSREAETVADAPAPAAPSSLAAKRAAWARGPITSPAPAAAAPANAAPLALAPAPAAAQAARGATPLSAVARRGGAPAQRKGVAAISRAYWHANPAQTARMTRMGGYDRITVHHEGNATPNYDSSVTAVAASLRRIQSEHCKRMGAGDIGYHFIIDRQGMIWQGRELCYQGAHVKSNNSNNIGIMCLGNFEIQQPTQAQVNTLASLCRALMAGYHIPANRLYGHRELRNTACPGRNLYPQLVNIRKQVVALV